MSERTHTLISTSCSKVTNLAALSLLLISSTLAICVSTSSVVYADTLGYPWPTDTEAPCYYGTNGGSSCVNPNDPTNQSYWYSWGEYDGSGTFHAYRNGYEYRNCTDYTQWKESTIGVSVPGTWGNGGQWYSNAPTNEQSTTPNAWDAAVVVGTIGHVAFVESVNTNGTITVSEYNHDTQGHGDTRTDTPANMGFTKYVDFGVHPPTIHFQPFAADFNHDGYADIGLRDATGGTFFIKHGPSFTDQITYNWAIGTQYQPFAADFDGDGIGDIGLYDQSAGVFFIKHGPSFTDQLTYSWAAGTQFQAFVGDFNGDGYADIGLRDMNVGTFFIKHGPSFTDQITYNWAQGSKYQPYAADFDGDHIGDIGVRDQQAGTFFIKHGTSFADQLSYSWAIGTQFQPFAADFDGNGQADIGLRDKNTGTFFIKHGPTFNDQLTYSWVKD